MSDESIAPTEPAVAAPRPASDRVDRYLLLDVLGAGAMGTVYAAYDPALDRKVAVKLLHTAGAGEAEQARLMREARALAQVTSQHVVAVHDVGVAGDRQYIAMELIAGTTLRAWLAQPRGWHEVVAVFEAAGRGLAAAHAAGLVHRDFKPDNVLIAGDRVCVADFGLAAAQPPAGEVAGTRRYMAPEVAAGAPADARSDQYSFCVALDEAIPAGPAALRKLIARGRAADPAERHGSLDDLLTQLARVRTRGRRRSLAIGAAVLVGASAAVAVLASRSDRDPCRDAERVSAAPYDPVALRVAFTTAAPDGAAAAERVIARLDAWQRDVAATRGAVCRAETAATFDLRMACLARLDEQVRALAAELAHPTVALVDGAPTALARAANVHACDTPAAVPARDPATQVLADQLTRRLADLRAEVIAGRYEQAIPQGKQIATEAATAGLADLEARGWEAAARTEQATDQFVAAEETYRKAIAATERSGDDHLRADLYQSLSLVALSLGDIPGGERWTEQTAALVDRLHFTDLAWAVSYSRGYLASKRGDKPATLAHYTQAIALYKRDHPEPDDQLANMLSALAGEQDLATARTTSDEAIHIMETMYGPQHPELIDILTTRASVELLADHVDLAQPFVRRAYAIAEATVGRNPEHLVRTAQLLAATYLWHLDWANALRVYDRAIPLYERASGRNNQLADVLVLRGEVLVQFQRFDAALADKLESLAIKRSLFPPDAPEVAEALEWLGRTQREAKHFDDALRSYREALAIRGRHPDAPGAAGEDELGIGETLIDAGKPAEALAHLEQAIALAGQPGANDARIVPEAHAELGMAYLALHQKPRAIAALEQARTEYQPLAVQADRASDLQEVEHLLAEARAH